MLNELKKTETPLFFSKNSAFTPLEKKNSNEKSKPLMNSQSSHKKSYSQPLKNSLWGDILSFFDSNMSITYLLSIFGFYKETKEVERFIEVEHQPLIDNEQIENLDNLKP